MRVRSRADEQSDSPPLLFAGLVGCLLLTYLGHGHGGTLVTVLAASSAAIALAALCAHVIRTDARLAAEESDQPRPAGRRGA